MKKSSAKVKDFKKNKLKLGTARGLKKKAATHTDLTLHTRIINLPTQSVSGDKGTMVTSRHLELPDLLSQLSHHNDNVRKDALTGMVELFTLHPTTLSQHISEVVEKTVEMMLDGSPAVRKALNGLVTFLFETLEQQFIAPFLHLFVVYISSAMSHNHKEVSVDGVKILNLWMEVYPSLIITKYKQLIPQYTRLIWETNPLAFHVQQQGNKTKQHMDPHEKRLFIFKSFMDYLDLVCTYDNPKSSYPDAEDSTAESLLSYSLEAGIPSRPFSKLRRYHEASPYPVDEILDSKSLATQTINNENKFDSIVGKSLNTKGPKEVDLDTREGVISFALRLCPLLFGTWIECFPSEDEEKFGKNDVVGAAKKSTNLAMIASVLTIIKLILDRVSVYVPDAASQNQVFEMYCKDMLKFVVQLFPFQNNFKIDRRNAKSNEGSLLIDVDITICKILCHFLPLLSLSTASEEADLSSNHESDSESAGEVGTGNHAEWVQKVHSFLVSSIESATPDTNTKKSKRTSKYKKSQPTTQTEATEDQEDESEVVAVELLPLVYKLLPYVREVQQLHLVEVFSSLMLNTDAKSSTKFSCLQFLRSLLKDADLKELWKNSIEADSSGTTPTDGNQDVEMTSGATKKRKREDDSPFCSLKKAKTAEPIEKEEQPENIATRNKYRTRYSHFHTWLLSLPKYLWQLQATQPETSQTIISLLKFCLGRLPSSLTSSPLLESLQGGLVPFFYTTFGKDKPKSIYGPFLSLPQELQKSAIDLLFYLRPLSNNLTRSLAVCLSASSLPSSIIIYSLGLFSASTHFSSAGQFLSFLLSILVGTKAEQDYPQIIGAIVSSVRNLRIDSGSFFQILLPYLLPYLENPGKNSQGAHKALLFISFYVSDTIQNELAKISSSEMHTDSESNRFCPLPERLIKILPSAMLSDILALSKPKVDTDIPSTAFNFANYTPLNSLLPLYPVLLANFVELVVSKLKGEDTDQEVTFSNLLSETLKLDNLKVLYNENNVIICKALKTVTTNIDKIHKAKQEEVKLTLKLM